MMLSEGLWLNWGHPMPFYRNWGFALVVIWVVTFFANWAVHGGDPINLVVFELGATLIWLILYVRFGRQAVANAGNATPVHLWIVAGLSALWSALGAYSYVMIQTRDNIYFQVGRTDVERAYFDGLPSFIEGAWACGVWGALAGSLLLPVRSRYALIGFAISLAGMVITWVYQYGFSPVPEMKNYIWPDVINGAVGVGLVLYAWRREVRRTAR